MLKGAAAGDWYPVRALELGKEGAVLLRCGVTHSRTERCEVVDEYPAGLRFADTALRMADKLGAPGSDWPYVPLFYRWTIVGSKCQRDRPTDQGLMTIVTTKPEAAPKPDAK